VGVASVGALSIREGLITKAPNIGKLSLNLLDAIAPVHRGPLMLLNDCTAAALGETMFGAARGSKNAFYLTISTGIGGGAIVDGHLLLGKDGNAVEIGHLVVEHDSRVRCGCGGYGHWEALCSGTGLPKLAVSMLGNKFKQRWREAQNIFDDCRRGDGSARRVLSRAATINAAGLASIINAYDPEILTVGGGVALNNKRTVLDWSLKHLHRYIVVRPPKIMLTPLGEEAPLMGAVAVAIRPPAEAVLRP